VEITGGNHRGEITRGVHLLRLAYQRKSLTIDPFKRHTWNIITIILFTESETMGHKTQIEVGGLNSGESSTKHSHDSGYRPGS